MIQQYESLLAQAKPIQQAHTGEYTLGRNPLTADIVLGMKNVMGFYGIVFKPNGSVVVNRAPANGGPQQVLPAGSFDFAALQALVQQKTSVDADILSLQAGLPPLAKGQLQALMTTRQELASQIAELKATAGSQLNLVA